MDTEAVISLNLVCLVSIVGLVYFYRKAKKVYTRQEKRGLVARFLVFLMVLVVIPATTYLLI